MAVRDPSSQQYWIGGTPDVGVVLKRVGDGQKYWIFGSPFVSILPPAEQVVSPGNASLTFTGGTPTLSSNRVIPGAGSLVFTGGTPTAIAGLARPAAGTLTFTGGTPTAFQNPDSVSPGAGSLTFTGLTPVASRRLTPGLAFLNFTGAAVALTHAGIVATPKGFLVFNPGRPVVSQVRKTAAGTQLFIGDTFNGLWRANTFNTDRNLSSGTTANFELEYYGGPRPKRRDDVSLFVDGTKRLGGIIQSIKERSRPGHPDQSILTIQVVGYETYANRRIVAELFTLISGGGLPGIIVFNLWFKYLTVFGITKVGDAGPIVVLPDQLFHYITLTEALNTLRDQSPGWDWWIDDNKVFHFDQTDGIAANAPFSISRAINASSADANAGISATETDSNFRDRQYVLPSNDLQQLHVEAYVGDGTTTAFPTTFVQTDPPIVRVNGVGQIVTEFGVWITGWQAYYIPGGVGVFFATAPGAGLPIDVEYPSPFPIAAVAEDATAIAAQGLYESVVHEKNIVDFGTATAEAEGLLTLYNDANNTPQQIEYNYTSAQQAAWLTPGMIADINWTRPDYTGTAVVEQVTSQESNLRMWRHHVIFRVGPGNMTDDQALAKVALNSQRNFIAGLPQRITLEPDIDGVGLQVGNLPSKNVYVFQESGVFTFWQALFASDPPVGSNIQIDALLNGTSIFTGVGKIIARSGVTVLQSGITFSSPNLAFNKGDVLRFFIDQVGSTNPGRFGVIYIGVKYAPPTH